MRKQDSMKIMMMISLKSMADGISEFLIDHASHSSHQAEAPPISSSSDDVLFV